MSKQQRGICQYQREGRCSYPGCQFLHRADVVTAAPVPAQKNFGSSPTAHQNRKTEICPHYTKTGCCNFGEKCKFVHSRTEAKPSQQPISSFPSGQFNVTNPSAIHNNFVLNKV